MSTIFFGVEELGNVVAAVASVHYADLNELARAEYVYAIAGALAPYSTVNAAAFRVRYPHHADEAERGHTAGEISEWAESYLVCGDADLSAAASTARLLCYNLDDFGAPCFEELQAKLAAEIELAKAKMAEAA